MNGYAEACAWITELRRVYCLCVPRKPESRLRPPPRHRHRLPAATANARPARYMAPGRLERWQQQPAYSAFAARRSFVDTREPVKRNVDRQFSNLFTASIVR